MVAWVPKRLHLDLCHAHDGLLKYFRLLCHIFAVGGASADDVELCQFLVVTVQQNEVSTGVVGGNVVAAEPALYLPYVVDNLREGERPALAWVIVILRHVDILFCTGESTRVAADLPDGLPSM